MAEDIASGGEKKAAERPTLDEGSGAFGKFVKLLVVLAILGGGGYFAFTKGYHLLLLEKFGYTLTENGIEKIAPAEADGEEPSAETGGEEAPAVEEAPSKDDAADEEPAGPEEKDEAEEKPGETAVEEKPFNGYEWVNVVPDNRIGGRQASPGYLRGKTVLIDCRDYGSKAAAQEAKALQQLWSTYKTKEFMVIGCHTGEAEPARVSKMMEQAGLTYPVYKDAGLVGADGDRVALGSLSILDSTGRRFLHRGSDVRRASGIVGNLLFASKRPSTPAAWKWLLDWEIENMPGHGYNRLKDLMSDATASAEMRKKFPSDMQRYSNAFASMKKSAETVRTAKLVALAVAVKDRDVNSAESKKLTKATLSSAMAKFADLKESADPRIVQEAKNAIADLTFASAALKR